MALRLSDKPKKSVVDRNCNERCNPEREQNAGRNVCGAEVFEIVAHCSGPSRGGAPGPMMISTSVKSWMCRAICVSHVEPAVDRTINSICRGC